MNTPVFSPIMVLPLEADALPGGGSGVGWKWESDYVTGKCGGQSNSVERGGNKREKIDITKKSRGGRKRPK